MAQEKVNKLTGEITEHVRQVKLTKRANGTYRRQMCYANCVSKTNQADLNRNNINKLLERMTAHDLENQLKSQPGGTYGTFINSQSYNETLIKIQSMERDFNELDPSIRNKFRDFNEFLDSVKSESYEIWKQKGIIVEKKTKSQPDVKNEQTQTNEKTPGSDKKTKKQNPDPDSE